MADVVNSIATSPQGRPNAYTTSSCSSNNALVSPTIVEAIDRIFPKSPSQLLAHPFSESLSSKRASSDALPHSQSNNIVSTLPCIVSMAHLTTDTTTTATAIFTGLTTSSGTKSPVMSSTATNHTDVPSLPAQAKVNQGSFHKNGALDISLKNPDVQKDFSPARGISKADLEIMTNFSNNDILNGRSGRVSMSDKEISDSQSKDVSDSDDMCRPFVSLQKEKKKKKRKQKTCEQKTDESTKNLNYPFSFPSSTKISKFSLQAAMLGNSNEDYHCHQNKNNSSIVGPLAEDHCSDLNGLEHEISPHEQDKMSSSGDHSNSSTLVLSPTDSIQKKTCLTSKGSGFRQKLPKSKHRKYHVSKDRTRIKKLFPPSFVVLTKIDQLLQVSNFGNSIDFNMSTKERVQVLSALCVQNKISCISRQKTIDEVFSYKNPIDDSIMFNNSEDEFRLPQGRSLRKRRQDICYVEPSEDDLLEDISVTSRKKGSGQSKKDISSKKAVTAENAPPLKNDNESSKEISHKHKVKKSKVTEHETVTISVSSSQSKDKKSSLPLTEPSVQILENTSPLTAVTSISKNVHHLFRSATTTSNLVYVYPKKSIVATTAQRSASITMSALDQAPTNIHIAKQTSSTAKIPKPGPASKTNRPPNIVMSKASVSTLNLLTGSNAAHLPIGFSGTQLTGAALPQSFPTLASSLSTLTQKNNNLSSNLCMVKIDGKDYLLSMPGSNNILAQPGNTLSSTSSTVIPFSQPSLVSAAGPRYMLYQPGAGVMPGYRPAVLSQSSVTTKSLTPAFSIPRLSTAVTLSGRASSSTIHLLPSSLTSNSTLSSSSLFGNTQVSMTPSSEAVSSDKNLTSSAQSNIVNQKTSSLVSIATSAGSSSSPSQSLSTVITTTSGTRHVRSLVSPLIAPNSTTVIRHHPGQTSNSSPSTVQLVAPNTSVSGARCFRIIVPACSATGTSARIATLGTSALSSPLTRLSASSTLLPQRKHSVDKDMSPEKRAAKRRRLEKKYPLPPGVVIKTEPLDTPQSSPSVQSGPVRSLLSGQNIQLIAASSRSGVSGVQRFRIITPNTPGVVVGTRPVRLSSNVIIRAPLIAPSTSRMPSSSLFSLATNSISSTALSSLSTSTLSGAVSGTASKATLSASLTTTTNAGFVSSASTTSSSRGTISLLSPGTLLLSSGIGTSVASDNVCTSTTSSSTCDTSCSISSSITTRVSAQVSPQSGGLTDISASVATDTTLPNSESRKDPSSSDSSVPSGTQVGSKASSSTVADIETTRQSIKKLHDLIQAQEAQGLKGARLDKLKEVLSQKEKLLSQLEQEVEAMQSNGNEVATVDNGTTEDNPFVIE